jgi:hypothetical protein
VIEDYDLTNLFRRPVPHLFGPETPQEVMAMVLSAQPKYLEAAFDEIDRVYTHSTIFSTERSVSASPTGGALPTC